MIPTTAKTNVPRVRVTFDLNAEDACDLFTELNKVRDDRYDGARTPAAIKEALAFSQLVARLRAAYIRGIPVETD